MKSPSPGFTLLLSLAYSFFFWSFPAKSDWLETIQMNHVRAPVSVIEVKVNQNIRLAQLSPAERQKEAEHAEKAALKKLENLKKKLKQKKKAKEEKKQADLKKAKEEKRKEEARLEKERQLRIKEQARLKAEEKARQVKHAKEEKKRLTKLIKDKNLTGHPCSEYDIENKKQTLKCMKALEIAQAKNSDLPNLWLERGTCDDMKNVFGQNLESMGFWKEVIEKRTPDCRMFAALYKENKGEDVFWGKCVNGPSSNPQEIFDCLSFGKRIYGHSPASHYPPIYRANLTAAGFNVGQEVEHRYQGHIWKPVYMLAMEQKRIYQAKQGERMEAHLYKLYYDETPKRKITKYSDAERKMMKNGRIKVPARYPAPTSEEIRLAVMRSMVNRANGGQGGGPGDPYAKVMKRHKRVGAAVVTDGNTIYLPKGKPAAVGMQIEFRKVKNVRCSKGNGSGGYKCQYRLDTQADADLYSQDKMGRSNFLNTNPLENMAAKLGGGKNIARMSVEFMSRIENYSKWFVLTENGWRQPHTSGGRQEIRDHERSVSQSLQQQRNNQRQDDSLIGGTLQGVSNAMASRGANAALELRRLW